MEMVLLTALGVGGATIVGAVIGFIFKNISHKFSDIVLSFAAGVMLSAANAGAHPSTSIKLSTIARSLLLVFAIKITFLF